MLGYDIVDIGTVSSRWFVDEVVDAFLHEDQGAGAGTLPTPAAWSALAALGFERGGVDAPSLRISSRMSAWV